MGSVYSIRFRPSVQKDLRRLPSRVVSRVIAHIESLAANPLPPGALRLTDAQRLYRVRVGDYRIIYEVAEEHQAVTIHYVRHRRDAYRNL